MGFDFINQELIALWNMPKQ